MWCVSSVWAHCAAVEGACEFGVAMRGVCCDVNNCGYDLSGDMFRHFYKTIRPRLATHGMLHWIDQRKYIPVWRHNSTWQNSGLARLTMAAGCVNVVSVHIVRWALAYVPTSCQTQLNECRVHVSAPITTFIT